MSEEIDGHKVFSLSEVTRSIQRTISERYKNSFWVKAEMNKLNYYRQSGHCYPDLVDKQDGKITAQIRAHLWNADFIRINAKFQQVLKEPLKDGIKILFLAKVSFDPSHGLALWIQDIDPSYTLGDLEKEKSDTINRLKEENLFDANRRRKLALLPKRVAIISVESSKGYADFLQVLQSNAWNYSFSLKLFPALLQGDSAVSSIVAQLNRIKRLQNCFDVVAIIRGGGGEVGLSCYNNYNLSKAVTEFPLPVITGIGHATNETVTELVAYANAITPTKLAEMLLQKFHDFAGPVNDAVQVITQRASRLLSDNNALLRSTVRLLNSVSGSALQLNGNYLFSSKTVLSNGSKRLFVQRRLTIDAIERNIVNLSPENVLKRGFSITKFQDKAISTVSELKPGDEIRTVLYKGELSSIVNKSKSTHE